ncbi:PKD-like family lipoprotein [Chitinophaga nivalis]|uniref:PKD-like family lipoprotein n=1 Tax=Chitinophaga nivalis TaxID=2991709 RepID=A0ABT3INZ5_9BACT|nr:PKD-like family lipoprotein [Chitinophaga nivalis]MCW3464613.1 PKD-like family lipoprotein [Chitinophaga nivalis]MCW3485696.1 PKD-like family lipoprotein [Chitinophaga nivalis]
MKKYILLSLLFLGLIACYKDKGNYDYLSLKKITIDSILDVKRYYMDSLIIEPVITVDKGDFNELDFEWSMMPTTGVFEPLPSEPEVIANTRVLRIQIKKESREFPYIMVLRVIDKATGVSVFRRFQLTISSPYASGWLVLSDRNHVSDVDIVTPDGDVHSRIYENVNGKPMTDHGLRLSLTGSLNGKDELYIQTDNNILQIRNPEFTYLRDAASMFYSMPGVVKPQVLTINDMATQRYLISNGQIFVAATLNNGKYSLPLVGNYEAAPFVASGGAYSAIYDKKNGRFLKFPARTNAVTMEAFTELKPDPVFDVNNVKGTLLFVERGSDYTYHIFRNADGKLQLYGLNTGSNDIPAGMTQAIEPAEMQQLSAVVISGALPMAYFTSGHSLYMYDIYANTAKKLYDFPGNATVSVIRMLKEWRHVDDNTLLTVGVNEGDAGSVYFFKLLGTGDLQGGTYKNKFTGFGRISDIIYKSK